MIILSNHSEWEIARGAKFKFFWWLLAHPSYSKHPQASGWLNRIVTSTERRGTELQPAYSERKISWLDMESIALSLIQWTERSAPERDELLMSQILTLRRRNRKQRTQPWVPGHTFTPLLTHKPWCLNSNAEGGPTATAVQRLSNRLHYIGMEFCSCKI